MATYSNTTRAQMRQKVRDQLFSTFWVDDELNRLINESLRVWNVLTGYFRQTTTVTIPADTVFYNLNDNVPNHLWLMRIEFEDTHVDMGSMYELDKMNATWMCDTGTTQIVMPIGLNLLALWPVPDTDVVARVESVRTAILPTTDADFIQVSEEDIAALVDYCHFVAVLKEGGQELTDAQPSLQYFLSQAAKHNAKLNAISVFRKMLGFGGLKPTRPQYWERTSPRGQDPKK